MLPNLKTQPRALRATSNRLRNRHRSIPLGLDVLERREVLSTFLVSNLAGSGAGSLRQAIVDSNHTTGPNTIAFDVSGTISVGKCSLPSIVRPVTLDGTTAPGFQGAPAVTVDFQGTQGLKFASGSSGSSLLSLDLVNSGGAGVTLASSHLTVEGNDIGVLADGTTVYGNAGDGIRIESTSSGDLIGQATTPTSGATPVSNLISGNGGNGIGVYGARNNVIAENAIGTNLSGSVALANHQNGILLTKGASGNTIGGTASGGNNPTQSIFVRPPQGNLISGNQGDGVLITGKATRNVLSGNFIGTSASGNSAVGNQLDGVAIVGANNNQLIGCTLTDSPFVYYNVISGNGGNGLRITNSNGTTVHANFLGAGANNATIVANGGDGLLVSGTSKQTQVGGVIPLGNVISGNARNGIEVKDKASGFTSFNTFAGIYAFLGAAPNKLDGILITSTGGNNLIRTCIVSGNLGNGIEIGGNASGVQVTDTAVGTSTNIQSAIPNGGSGIVLTGTTHNNFIGGRQVSVEKQVDSSSNLGYGIAVIGRAHDNQIANANIGSGDFGITALGNALGGIYLGSGTSGTTIGSTNPALVAQVKDNLGAGIAIVGSSRNVILGSTIFNNATGIFLINGRNNQIGQPGAGNVISSNKQDGVSLSGNSSGTKVQANTINQNQANGVKLVNVRNVTVGGRRLTQGNLIVNNVDYGIDQEGQNPGTVIQGNTLIGNGK